MISIVVPVYNAEKKIRRCIDSILSQVYENWELILIDDGSSDNSGDVCDYYAQKDARIEVLHQENQGPSIARNKGLAIARGEYVCFIDADDYVLPSYLSDFNLDSGVDMALQGLTLSYAKSNSEIKMQPLSTFVSNREPFLANMNNCYNLLLGPVCKAYKAILVRKYGIKFPIDIKYGEDRVFVLQYLSCCGGRFYVNAVSNYVYTHDDENSLTAQRKSSQELYDSTLKQYEGLLNLKESYTTLPEGFSNFYRYILAIDLYQSIYNCFIESKCKVWKLLKFIRKIDSSLLGFVNGEKNLPKTFRILSFIVAFIK